MGASGWEYFVPYQSDIAAALRDLRHETYREHFSNRDVRGEAINRLRQYTGDWYLDNMYPDPDDRERQREEIENRIRDLETQSLPDNPDDQIAELLEISAEEGTGSILDMEGVSEQEEFFRIAPLLTSELKRIYGTDKPDHQMVVSKKGEVMTLRDSQKGSYLIVYKDGQPDEIFFGGFSGD